PMAAIRLFPPSAALIVLVHLVATAYMTGVIWFVQLVHYPLMAGWPHDQFAVWEARHRDLTGFVVIPGMLLEAGSVVLLLMFSPRRVSPWLIGAGAFLAIGLWTSTMSAAEGGKSRIAAMGRSFATPRARPCHEQDTLRASNRGTSFSARPLAL
ncbi:MAG: hypothetical protein ACKOTB_14930, partial [Planctomycetia bacterium]